MSDSLLGLDEPPQPRDATNGAAYRVLARKYRPQTFAELIGQDAMVQTLGNAIRRDRLAHAFLLTGVRGVGKTSTARLIAKALNCIGPDGQGGPTIDPCGQCTPCRQIAEGKYIDVLEQDAASNTKVEQMRELLDSVPYAPAAARYKIYIIDEVHMLSNSSFNALLKTLEEPPPHVKFLFATTEVHKVPVTVLSRCQRFDLRRIPAEMLAAHFAKVCAAEGVEAEGEALALIARAAEGSARDGLSILDQAIAHAGQDGGTPVVRADAVRDMLGLSDRGAMRELFAMLLAGDGPAALAALRQQYDLGVDPLAVLRTLLETVHATTLVKLGTPPDAGKAAEERAAFDGWAQGLSFAVLHRLWQLLLRGHDEVAKAAMPIEACEMVLLRIVHASTLPDPGELARQIASGALPAGGAAPARSPAPATAPGTSALGTSALGSSATAMADGAPDAAIPMPADFAGLIALLEDKGAHALAAQLRHGARVVRYAPPELVLSTSRPVAADLLRELPADLRRITGQIWKVSTDDAPGTPTMREQEAAAKEAMRQAIADTPVVKAALAHFPDAEIEDGEIERLMAARRSM